MRTVRFDEAAGLYRMPGQKPLGEPRRCPTCGRAFDCCCGDDCMFCEDGRPVALAGQPRLPGEDIGFSREGLERLHSAVSGQAAIGASTPQQNSQTQREESRGKPAPTWLEDK